MTLGIALLLFQASAATPIELDIAKAGSAYLDECAITVELTVCGRRNDRYRLPLPRDPDPDTRRRGDVPGGVAALTPAAPCGIFAGQRHCSKAEAARYGYGAGRDPLTLATKLARRLGDPDAD